MLINEGVDITPILDIHQDDLFVDRLKIKSIVRNRDDVDNFCNQ